MKKVFSITILLFLLVAASFAGATYWFGVEAEQQYRETLEQASQSIYIHAANESYDRGFLRSKAHTAVKIRDLSRGSEQQEEFLGFTLIHDIRHGPLPVGGLPDGKMQLKPVLAIIDTRIELDPDTQGRLKKTFDVLPEIASMENCTTLSIGGNGETRLVIPPLRQTLGKDKKVSLDWKGLTASMTFTADFKGYTGTLSAPGLEIVGDDGILEIQGLASTFDTHEGVSGLFLGDASVDLAHFQIQQKENGEKKRFSMDGLKMTTISQALTDTVNYSMAFRIDQAITDDTSYGPGTCELEIRKLDTASLAELQQVFQELEDQFPHRSIEEINQMMLAKYAEILPGLIKKSPEIEITQLSLKTTDGDFLGKAKIVFDGTNAAAMTNPLFLLSALTTHAEFTITDSMLHRIHESSHRQKIAEAVRQGKVEPLSDEEIKALAQTRSKESLETLVAQNILIYEDGNYKASADYQQGRIMLNGRPLTLQDLLQ